MRTNRPYVQIDPDVLERVRQIDLLSYLREFEPSNLVKVKGTSNVYCTAEHDSLKISNGKWYWWSRGFGGYSALDYLIKVKEYDFVEAVEILTGQTMADWKPPPAPKKDKPKVLLLPPKNKDCNRVIQYLFGRGIDYQLIQECISDGTLYESADYHNAVFIGKDESGTPKYAALRGTLGSTFKQDASGSDKQYSFRLLAKKPADTVHLFEAAIDLLSYATYVWITNNFERRSAEWARKGRVIQHYVDGVDRTSARYVEQAVIDTFGMKKNGGLLDNKINSIAPKPVTIYERFKRFMKPLI